MADILDLAIKRRVLYEKGKFQNVNGGERRFVEAPFCLVTIPTSVADSGARSFAISTASRFGDAGQLHQTETREDQFALAREDFGFLSDLAPMVMSEHELGNWKERDDWVGVHRFSWL